MSGLSRVIPLFQRGRASITSQAVAGSNNFVKTITLNRADYTHGMVVVANPDSLAEKNQRRATAVVFLTTVLSQARAQGTVKKTQTFVGYAGPLYTVINWQHKAFFYDVDARLSDAIFQEESLDFTSLRGIKLLSAQIDGAALKLIFRNTQSIASRTLTVDIDFNVEKAKLLS